MIIIDNEIGNSIVTQIEMKEHYSNPDIDCCSRHERCKWLKTLPLMKTKRWCEIYHKIITPDVYGFPVKLSWCKLQQLEKMKPTFIYEEF